MSGGPFGTTTLRRLWAFVGLWGAAITSIIYYVTAPGADGVAGALQVVGVFYYRSQVALEAFAAAATVPKWLVLVAYAIVALLLLGIAVGVLLTGAADVEVGESGAVFLLLAVTTGVVVLSAVFLSLTLAGATAVTDLVGVVFQVTPPVLALAPIAVGIAVVTAYVP